LSNPVLQLQRALITLPAILQKLLETHLMKTPMGSTLDGGMSESRTAHASRNHTESDLRSAPADGYRCIAPDVKVGSNVKFSQFVNLYGCEVGDDTKIGAFVEIQKNAKVGMRCKISSHTFICEGVTIEDEVFVGHNVTFVNDTFPRATTETGTLQTEADWKVEVTVVKRGVSIGSGATILANVVIGENALIGAGCVVTTDVPANAIVVGNPGRVLRYLDNEGRS
jgi:acetyltransferase-like isoleucine patch superfamily enzyme